MEKSKNEHYVYKFVNDDEIIYIGKIDSNLKNRINNHFNSGKFDDYKNIEVYCAKLNNSLSTKYMEKLLINKYKPVLNKSDKSNDILSIDFIEPQWQKYEEYLTIDDTDEKYDERSNWDLKLDQTSYDSLGCLGNNIKNARLRRNLSADYLSKKIGISRVTLWKIESGNPDVAIGSYVTVLSAFKFEDELKDICKDTELILQMGKNTNKRASRHKR